MTGETLNKRFIARWGDRTVSGAARRALSALIPSVGESDIPVDLVSAAKYLGIDQVIEVQTTSFDGLLSVTKSGTYIVNIRSDQSPTRKRFTLAHEVGHLVLNRSLRADENIPRTERLVCTATSAEEKAEERLCDIVATELIMPCGAFLKVMEETGVCASTVPIIAKHFGVSLQAACRRILALLSYDIGMGVWTKNSEDGRLIPQWYFTRKGSVRPEYVIEAGKPGSSSFSDRTVRGWQWIPLHGRMDRYYVDISPLPRAAQSWLGFFIFSDAPHHVMATLNKSREHSTQPQLSLLRQ